jgi:hypothetical protein
MRILVDEIRMLTDVQATADPGAGRMTVEGAVFDLDARTITGEAGKAAEAARNQLRRRGIRFRYEVVDGVYRAWSGTGE